jgi:hypothetical protein
VASKVSAVQFVSHVEVALAPKFGLGTEEIALFSDEVGFCRAAQPARLATMRVIETTGTIFMRCKCSPPGKPLAPVVSAIQAEHDVPITSAIKAKRARLKSPGALFVSGIKPPPPPPPADR